MAFCSKCGNKIEENVNFCTQCGEKVSVPAETPSVQVVEEQPNETTPQTQISTVQQEHTPKKKLILKKKLIIAAISFVAVVSIFSVSYWLITKESPLSIIFGKELVLDENNNIILRQIRNYDKSQSDSLSLTLKDVKNTQNYIRKNYPDFDFEEEGWFSTDDYGNELLINDFNNNPKHARIYLLGQNAGYSYVYSNLYFSNLELGSYFFGLSEEYSDFSGIEYYYPYYPSYTYSTINEIILFKTKYSDSNDYYWFIIWSPEKTEIEKRQQLDWFLRILRNSKVFENIDIEWLKDIYTYIERNQRIRDIVDW